MADHKIVVTRDEHGLARLAALHPVTAQDRAEHYQPRCRPCHLRHDYKGRRPNGQFVSRQEVMPNDR